MKGKTASSSNLRQLRFSLSNTGASIHHWARSKFSTSSSSHSSNTSIRSLDFLRHTDQSSRTTLNGRSWSERFLSKREQIAFPFFRYERIANNFFEDCSTLLTYIRASAGSISWFPF